jgi:recombination protein RecA
MTPGFPRGLYTHLYGPEAGGKSSLAMVAAAAASKQEEVVYIDVEQKILPPYFERFVKAGGGNSDNVTLLKPTGATEAIRAVRESIDGGAGLVVLDSVAALPTEAELDASSPGDMFVGALARFLSQNIKTITPILSGSETALVFINQVREDIGGWAPRGTPTKPPGGRSARHSASLMVHVKRGATLKLNGREVGIVVRARTKKSSISPPSESGEINLFWGYGPDPGEDIRFAGLATGVLESAGAWYKWEEEELAWQGKKALYEAMRYDKDIRDRISIRIIEQITKQRNEYYERTATDVGGAERVDDE